MRAESPIDHILALATTAKEMWSLDTGEWEIRSRDRASARRKVTLPPDETTWIRTAASVMAVGMIAVVIGLALRGGAPSVVGTAHAAPAPAIVGITVTPIDVEPITRSSAITVTPLEVSPITEPVHAATQQRKKSRTLVKADRGKTTGKARTKKSRTR